jgi:hypothetical protein
MEGDPHTTVQTYVQEILGSEPGLDTGYHDWAFS